MNLTQEPQAGAHMVYHRGDVISITLKVSSGGVGTAWLRTNIGHAGTRCREIVEHVERGSPILFHDWHDVEMKQTGNGQYSITLPLTQVGRFEAKSYFMPSDSSDPLWPSGANVVVKVEPADYVCSSTIYNAFVRQFGPNMSESSEPFKQRTINTLEAKGYSVIPASGTFRNLIKELDLIMGELRFRVIQLLPVFPVPTTYGRMGPFGSPFAALGFMDVDSAYAELDRKTTPLEQFRELSDAIHCRQGKVFLDLPINHTGWGSEMQNEHPEWFARGGDRSFESPGAWGVTWEDLAKLDYRHRDLWIYMADVFLFWCEQGVDGFRCDAGYMVPLEVWEYIIAKVRLQFPDTIFFLEGLGGSLQVTADLLSKANMDWAYSELFQNYDRGQIAHYLPMAGSVTAHNGLLVHFAETHDNDRLASTSQAHSRMRTALCAMCSQNGGFGITNGVEWFADEKILVHGATSLRWGNDENQIGHLARLNAIMEAHLCFHYGAEMRVIEGGGANIFALRRVSADKKSSVLVIANLDSAASANASWRSELSGGVEEYLDLVSGSRVKPHIEKEKASIELAPGEVKCLVFDNMSGGAVEGVLQRRFCVPEAANRQGLKGKVLETIVFLDPEADVSLVDIDKAAEDMAADQRSFCAAVSGEELVPLTTWQWPRDSRREVMVPPGFLLHIISPHPFTAKLRLGDKVVCCESSLSASDGSFFTLIRPPVDSDEVRSSVVYTLDLSVWKREGMVQAVAPLVYLSSKKGVQIRTSFDDVDIRKRRLYALCTNGRGAMAQVRGAWGEIKTQYDAMLAANLNEECPVDRTVVLTRCRAWLVCRSYSQPLSIDCQKGMDVNDDGSVSWNFVVPAGQGFTVPVSIRMAMLEGRNAVTVDFKRHYADEENQDDLAGTVPIKLVIRPDIEWRFNHEKTKAYAGAEKFWPGSVNHSQSGFRFSPYGRSSLHVDMPGSRFTFQPEWQYMVPHTEDGERGLGDCSDLFSPGYFAVTLQVGESVTFTACVPEEGEDDVSVVNTSSMNGENDRDMKNESFHDLLYRAMRQFIVSRDEAKTVIAGYPWFLDWGRDTLICLRGIISAGMLDEAGDILRQFAFFEESGTLPNMIHGKDASNRDTSDAPLWFFVACSDLCKKTGDSFLDTSLGDRPIRKVLFSIAENYIAGTRNNIRMDSESGLIFSPSHFTWMDTNHPACTPRAGYPIEIQALWYFALKFLSELDSDERWVALAGRVQRSIMKYYPVVSGEGSYRREFLSDCLHADFGQSASEARRDNHLRPNQLFAVTLGALADRVMAGKVIASCEELLVPGAIRSLADRENDSSYPYRGEYKGEEDTSRKPAYHNGTAWTWPFPSYCEALVMLYGGAALNSARAILYSSMELINSGCACQVPEIIDGDAPHRQRGCGAQAWGVTELYRVEDILNGIGTI